MIYSVDKKNIPQRHGDHGQVVVRLWSLAGKAPPLVLSDKAEFTRNNLWIHKFSSSPLIDETNELNVAGKTRRKIWPTVAMDQ